MVQFIYFHSFLLILCFFVVFLCPFMLCLDPFMHGFGNQNANLSPVQSGVLFCHRCHPAPHPPPPLRVVWSVHPHYSLLSQNSLDRFGQ